MLVRRFLTTMILFGFFGSALAADPRTDRSRSVLRPARDSVQPAPERMEDPPVSAATLGARSSSVAAVVTFGNHVSVQVNVNELGNNIVGDAGNEPSMAIDAANPNRIAIGWRQFDSLLSNFREAGVAYSIDGGTTWSFSGVLENNRFRSDPVLASDAFGNFFYSSLTTDPNGDFLVDVFRSTNGGQNWDGGVYSFGGDKQWLATDGRAAGMGAGHIYQAWNTQFSCCGTSDFTRSINHGASYQPPLNLPAPRMMWGTLAVDPTGVLYMAGAALDQNGHVFVRSRNALDPAVTPTFDEPVFVDLNGFTGNFSGNAGPNPAGLLGQVWVAVHPTRLGHVYVLASVWHYGDPADVMFTRSVDGGSTWSRPVQINDDALDSGAHQWFGTLSVAPNGRLDATWNDTRVSSDAWISAVYYSYSLDEGLTWSANEQVTPTFNSHVGFPNQNKMGDYAHQISDDFGVNLAYAATFNGEQDVYFLRINQDCNGNSRLDRCDLSCGASGGLCDVAGCGQSTDCNQNRVPDECEPIDDCNFNKQNDLCEIQTNPAMDCNFNGRIDHCEDPRDCNDNGVPDVCDVYFGGDCDGDNIPDECYAALPGNDRNGDSVPDWCQGGCCDCFGCEDLGFFQCSVRDGNFTEYAVLCGDAEACVPPLFANDTCSQAAEIPGVAEFAFDFDTRCASTDGPEFVPCPADQPMGKDLWYSYHAPCSGQLLVSTCEGTFFDGMLAVYGGEDDCVCPINNDTLLTCGDDTCDVSGGPAAVQLSVTAGRCYTVRLGGWGGDSNWGSLELTYLTLCRPTDVNGDGATNLLDFARFQNCFGSSSEDCAFADFDGSGEVDLADFVVFLSALVN